jgi:hypothetical protein
VTAAQWIAVSLLAAALFLLIYGERISNHISRGNQ